MTMLEENGLKTKLQDIYDLGIYPVLITFGFGLLFVGVVSALVLNIFMLMYIISHISLFAAIALLILELVALEFFVLVK